MKPLSILLFCLAALANANPFPPTARTDDGYALAQPGVTLEFPRDHGSHPEFKTEWWYITGHLAGDNKDLGFQITFFRSADKASPDAAASQIYMAHAAIIDKRSGAFLHEERLNSDQWNAAAQTGGLDLYNGNWYLRMNDPTTERMQTRFSLKNAGVFNLTLEPAKSKTLFGEAGYSKKGDAPGAASYYITFSRLAVQGTLELAGETISLGGNAWMDHEFSSSQLTAEQIGWNWSSLILDDGSELMAYVMRRGDGQTDPNSRLTVIAPDGKTTEYGGHAFTWKPTRYWTSPVSKGRYPVEYEISWGERRVTIVPETDDQELRGRIGDFVYWEGAGRVLDQSGQPIGQCYTELTGYAESLYGKF